MNPYNFVCNNSQLGPTSQGDLGALYAVLKVLADGYSSGYAGHTHGGAYRYVVANFPEGTFKRYVERIFAPELGENLMPFVEPISNRHCHSQAEADALHAEIIRIQNIILRSNHDRTDAERAELFRVGIGVSPVDEPKSYRRVHRDGASIAEPPSISVIPANHVTKRRRKFLFW